MMILIKRGVVYMNSLKDLAIATGIFMLLLGLATIVSAAELAYYKRSKKASFVKMSHFFLSFVTPAIEEALKIFALHQGETVMWLYLVMFNTYEFSMYYNGLKTTCGKKKAILLRGSTFMMHMITGVLHVTGFSILAWLLHTIWNSASIYGVIILERFKEKRRKQKFRKVAQEAIGNSLNEFMKGR